MPTLKVDESIFTGHFFCQNASVWNRFQLYIDDKGKLWVTNTKKGDKPTKKTRCGHKSDKNKYS